MKSEKEQGNAQNSTSTANYANSINTGSVGFEGDGDNGASTLRVLKKKHSHDSENKASRRKPVL